jgi:hypothetical protein
MNADAFVDTNLNLFAVEINGRKVATPHFSYGIWPPTLLDVGEIKTEFLSPSLEVRIPCNNLASYNKVASWLYLKQDFIPTKRLLKKIERSKNIGFTIESGGIHLIHDFWPCYSQHLHRLGSLPLPKDFFQLLMAGYDEGFAEFFILKKDSKVVGAACNYFYQGFYENGWFATTHDSQKHGGSYFMHDHMIRRAFELGASVYSFGRSTADSGVHQFKRQWNTVDVPLLWLKGGVPYQGKYALQFFKFIIKLLPLQLVRFIGKKASKVIY